MKALIAASLNSWRGLVAGFHSERAIRQEFALIVISIPCSLWIAQSGWVRMALVGSLLIVLSIEYINTGLEKLCDVVMPEYDLAIGFIKDVASSAVFVSVVLAVGIWSLAVWQWLSL